MNRFPLFAAAALTLVCAAIPAPGAPLYVPPVSAHHPVALRIEQTLEDGTTPSRTTLALEKNIGCWWVHL